MRLDERVFFIGQDIGPFGGSMQGARGLHEARRLHGVGDIRRYNNRMAAIEFAIEHDDGLSPRGLDRADVVLVAPSQAQTTKAVDLIPDDTLGFILIKDLRELSDRVEQLAKKALKFDDPLLAKAMKQFPDDGWIVGSVALRGGAPPAFEHGADEVHVVTRGNRGHRSDRGFAARQLMRRHFLEA